MDVHRFEQKGLLTTQIVILDEEQEKEGLADKCKEKVDHVAVELQNTQGEDLHVETGEQHEEKQDVETTEKLEIEDGHISDENLGSDSFEMLVDDSESEQTSSSSNNDDSEAPLTDAEVEELMSEFLEVESKAAEAQESLEEESLARVESEVRAELAENLEGDELERAVSTEMKTFTEEWESVLDDLENQSAMLLEQLDGAGVELPRLYKWIESQVPDVCSTEAWKKRAHWVGTRISNELDQSVKDAEEYLQSCRPMRRKHGRLLEDGASGYLAKNLSIKGGDNNMENCEQGWSSFGELIHSGQYLESTSFGSKNWAAVYLANTPQEAANLGLKIPGVDEVEEIGELEENPFYNEAIQNENEIGMSEEQKKKYKKVREEEDEKVTRKLQSRLERRRKQNKKAQEVIEKEVLNGVLLLNEAPSSFEKLSSPRNDASVDDNADALAQIINSTCEVSARMKDEHSIVCGSLKRPHESEDAESASKKPRTFIIDIDDEEQIVNIDSPSHDSVKVESPNLPVAKDIDIIDVDVLPSPSPGSRCNSTRGIADEICCTACSDAVRTSNMHKHPILKVIICGSCNFLVVDKMKTEDSNAGVYCSWCGRCKDLIKCNSCKALFCSMCISRNFGETRLAEVKANGWDCFCCSPALLHKFVSECERALGEFMTSSSESESELSGSEINVGIGNKRKKKKRIRRILDDAELGEETKKKIAIEKARQEHLKSMQAQSASKLCNMSRDSTKGILADSSMGDITEGYIVNIAREAEEDPVRIPPSISLKLKPHQVAGIRFMWDNIIQSIRKVKSGDKGLGCILAHTMGLGKTFQVIAFLYIAMRALDLGLRSALVVTPVNVLHNWRHEFTKWRPVELKPLRVLMLEDVSRERRANLLSKWRVKGGVLLIGYAAFRNLSLGRHMKDRNTAIEICHALHYGPDILVCDEAHMIKNTKADITQAFKQVQTQRRIALTGSPLQNNLMEYYCMVDFVREGYLGSSHEFRNRFQNPIENGQHANATMDDVKIMNQRSHILYEELKGFVQRMDMSIVKKDLPPKTVFVITVKLSPVQRKLYKRFLDVHGFTSEKASSEKTMRRSCFFAGYQALAQIWNHPGLLQLAKEQRNHLRREDAVENFLVEDSSSDDNMESDLLNGEKQRTKNGTFSKRSDGIFTSEGIDWWEDLLEEKIYKEADYSGKMVLLLEILAMSSEVGDKALVFSQSLTTLDLIELFLSKLPRKGREGKYWKQGKDWYRLDGSTQPFERQKLVERFNEPTNRRVKCTLISTRAGSLGINLHAANRVIIVDGSWNPTYDLQAIYRVWRYGQIKPVYAYRLMAHGTMEEKIYKRQVTKEGLAARVVDRQQIHRTMSKEEVLHLFDFGDDETTDVLDQNQSQLLSNEEKSEVELGKQKSLSLSNGTTCSDKFMESLLRRYYPRWIASYHEHETLLQENEAERLSKEEQEMAWQSYQRSLEWEEVHRVVYDEVKPTSNNCPPESSAAQQTKNNSRSRAVNPRKCTNLAHLLTLRSQGTKSGSSTICGQCSQEISWENLNRDGRSR